MRCIAAMNSARTCSSLTLGADLPPTSSGSAASINKTASKLDRKNLNMPAVYTANVESGSPEHRGTPRLRFADAEPNLLISAEGSARVACFALRILLSVLQCALGFLGDITHLRLSSTQVFVDGTFGLLRVTSGYAARHFLDLSSSFLHSAVNLIFINA